MEELNDTVFMDRQLVVRWRDGVEKKIMKREKAEE